MIQMPLPRPKENEDYQEFIERCMADENAVKEFPDSRERRAVCEQKWESGEMKKKPDRVLSAIYEQPWAITPEWFETIANIAERQNDEALFTKRGENRQETPSVEYREDGVAILSIIGPIVRYASIFSEVSGLTSIEKVSKDFQSLIDDPSVKSIVLNVDSPGGQVHGINEFSELVFQSRDKKPIYGYTGGNAASAGYWIITSAGEVWTDTTAWLGSIGVVIGLKNQSSDTLEIVSTNSPKKRVDPSTKDGREELLKRVDALAEIFIRTVARNRNVEESKVLSDFGQGAVFTGEKSVSLGMADKIGSLEGLISFLQNKNKEERIMSEDINALEQKVKDYEAKLKEREEKLESAQSKISELQKMTLKQDLSAKLGEIDSEFIMQFADKLTGEEISSMADKLQKYQKMVEEAGSARGSEETPTPSAEPTFEEVQKYADEKGITFTEANTELFKKKQK